MALTIRKVYDYTRNGALYTAKRLCATNKRVGYILKPQIVSAEDFTRALGFSETEIFAAWNGFEDTDTHYGDCIALACIVPGLFWDILKKANFVTGSMPAWLNNAGLIALIAPENL